MKIYKLLVLFSVFTLLFSFSFSESYARGIHNTGHHYHNGKHYDTRSANGHKPYDYDLEYLNKLTKHEKKSREKAQKISQDYLEKLKRPELQQYAQEVINTQQVDIQKLESWQNEWYSNK